MKSVLFVFTGSPGGNLVLLCQQRSESSRLHNKYTIFTIFRCSKLCSVYFMSLLSPQVQSEILKKWKRWKLGRNIEEEYRHTYSNTPNTKTTSLLNHAPRMPHLPDIAKTTAPVCSPEERHMLVASNQNGMVNSTEEGKCASLLHEGTISNYILVEDISITDKLQCYEVQKENMESHLWKLLGLLKKGSWMALGSHRALTDWPAQL